MTLLLHDFLFGKGIQCGGPLKQAVMKHKTRLKAELTRIKMRRGAIKDEELIPNDLREGLERGLCLFFGRD
jgi:putative methyltransferase